MGNVEGSIEALTQAILGEAKTETVDLHKRAQEQAELIRVRAREAAARESSAILDQAKEEVRRLHGQKAATAQSGTWTLRSPSATESMALKIRFNGLP